MNSVMRAAAAAVLGAAVGAAAVCAVSSDHRQIRHSIHRVARTAEKAMLDLDHMIEHYTR